MMSKEVPTAFFMGILSINTNAGITKNPPPAPKKPVAMPIKIPFNNSLIIWLLLGVLFADWYSGTFPLFIIAMEASNISRANNTMVAILWVI